MEIEHNVGLGGSFAATFDSEVFDLVVGMAEASSVNEAEGDTVEYESFFNGIARGAGYGTNDSAVVAKEGVEKGGFSCIGTANYGNGNATFYCVAQMKGCRQLAAVSSQLAAGGRQLAAIGEFDILLGEVEF